MKTYEVTNTQLNYLKYKYSGVIAYREEDNKYYVRVWWPGYTKEIEQYLNIY